MSTPSAPVEVGFLDALSARALAVSDGYAYLTDADVGLRIIDVGTPSAPVEVGSFATPGNASDLAVSGAFLFAAGDAGLQVVGVSTPSAPVDEGSLGALSSAFDVAVSGGYAYVGGGAGLYVIDVRTPSAQVPVGSLATNTWESFLYVTVSGGYDYTTEATQPTRDYFHGNVSSDITSSSSIRLFAGSARGGLKKRPPGGSRARSRRGSPTAR